MTSSIRVLPNYTHQLHTTHSTSPKPDSTIGNLFPASCKPSILKNIRENRFEVIKTFSLSTSFKDEHPFRIIGDYLLTTWKGGTNVYNISQGKLVKSFPNLFLSTWGHAISIDRDQLVVLEKRSNSKESKSNLATYSFTDSAPRIPNQELPYESVLNGSWIASVEGDHVSHRSLENPEKKQEILCSKLLQDGDAPSSLKLQYVIENRIYYTYKNSLWVYDLQRQVPLELQKNVHSIFQIFTDSDDAIIFLEDTHSPKIYIVGIMSNEVKQQVNNFTRNRCSDKCILVWKNVLLDHLNARGCVLGERCQQFDIKDVTYKSNRYDIIGVWNNQVVSCKEGLLKFENHDTKALRHDEFSRKHILRPLGHLLKNIGRTVAYLVSAVAHGVLFAPAAALGVGLTITFSPLLILFTLLDMNGYCNRFYPANADILMPMSSVGWCLPFVPFMYCSDMIKKSCAYIVQECKEISSYRIVSHSAHFS